MTTKSPCLPYAPRCRVEAYCEGLGWALFAYAQDVDGAIAKARQAKLLTPRHWPGKPVRQVRVLERVPLNVVTGEPGLVVKHVVDAPKFKSMEEVWKAKKQVNPQGGGSR